MHPQKVFQLKYNTIIMKNNRSIAPCNNCVNKNVKVIPVLTFPFLDAPCSDLQGMLSGLLPDAQISASSSRDMVWTPSSARLVASRSGWFPASVQPIVGEEWLQVVCIVLY